MANKITCTCGHSWDKSSSSKKDATICHICGKNVMKNGGWLDRYDDGGSMQEYQENYNDSKAFSSPDMQGDGFSNVGRNYSPAWGGQFQLGGSLPGSVGFTYARTKNIPSNGPYAKKTKASAQNGASIPVIEDIGDFKQGVWVPDLKAMAKEAKKLGTKKVKTKHGSVLHFNDKWEVIDVDDSPSAQNGKEMSFYQNGFDWDAKTISQDGTAVKKQSRDMRTLAERKADDAKALDAKLRAQQASLQKASSPINDERRRQLNERYAQQSGKRYNPTTGSIEDRFTPQQDRMLNRAYENIVEPMIDAEMIASAAPLVRKGVKAVGKYLTEETALKNAYRINPWAEKLINANKSYRVAGLDALEDFQNTGVLTSRNTRPAQSIEGTDFMIAPRPTPFPSFQKGYADMAYAPKEGAIIFETELPTFKRGEINPVTGFPITGRHYAHRVINPETGATMTQIPSKDIRVFGDKPDWLTGYKEIPTFKKSSLESVFSGDKLQEKFNKILNFQQLPELNNSNATEVLENFRKRIKTPEGKQRLKDLGITNKRILDDLKIVADETGLAYYSPQFGKIGIHPQLPEFRNVTRHEIEHAVQDAFGQSKMDKFSQDIGNLKYLFRPKAKREALEYVNKYTSDIDDLLSGLELRKTPEKVNWAETKATRGKQDPSELYDYMEDLQNATNYFDSGSGGAEKSAFLGEVQQHMMDKGIIPKDSYTKITPEMVKKTFIDAKFDENGGKYLRLFNIMKPNEKNYKLISDGLNKMLSATPIVGGAALGAAALQQKKQGGKITKDDNGYWNPNNWGKPVEIGSNNITMQGVHQPLIGISDEGDIQYMQPGEDYKFKGKKVVEYPVKKNGGWLEKYN